MTVRELLQRLLNEPLDAIVDARVPPCDCRAGYDANVTDLETTTISRGSWVTLDLAETK